MSDLPKTLTISQISVYTGIPVRTLYEMIEDSRFSVKPIEGTRPRRWNIQHVDAWLNGER